MQTVMFLSPVSFFKGGAERSLFDLMVNPNIKPILVSPDNGPLVEKAKLLGIETHIIPFKSINTVHRPFSFIKGLSVIKDLTVAAIKLNKLAKKSEVKIIHSNGLKAHAVNCVARMFGGTKAILHIRDIPYTRSEKAVWKILRTLSDNFVVVSGACWPETDLPAKVSVVYNGTPLIDNQTIASNVKTEQETFHVAFIGRIHPAKGLHLLIDWLAAARARGIPLKLSVRGTFSDDAPGYESEIKSQIIRHNLNNYVTFTGFISDPNKLYKDIDLTAVPSIIPDPLPRSVMESMARGIPVIGYPAGGIGEMIIDYQTGFMVKNEIEFENVFEFIRNNTNELSKITLAARKRIEDEFSLPRLHNKMKMIYSTHV